MLLGIVSFLLWIPALVGVGCVGYRIFLMRQPNQADKPWPFFDLAMVGLAIIATLANWLNFFMAVGPIIQILVGLVGWSFFVNALRQGRFSKPSIFLVTAGILWALILIFIRANTAPTYFDTGSYGLQNLKWYQDGPVLPGLGNLHARFAYNSAWFALASVVQLFSFDVFISGEILLWFMGMVIASSAEAFLKKQNNLSVLYGFLSGIFFVTPMLGAFGVSSLATDLPIFWLCSLLALTNLRWVDQKISTEYAIWFSCILAVFCVTIKLSALPVVFIALVPIFIAKTPRKLPGLLKTWASTSLFMITPWCIRFFIMSACIVYPISITCFPALPWAIPVESVTEMAGIVRIFAINRTTLPTPDNTPGLLWFTEKDFFTDWVELYVVYPETQFLLLSLAVAVLVYLASLFLKGEDRNKSTEITLLLPYLGGIVFWLLSAPDFRFGTGYLWPFTLMLLVFGTFHFLKRTDLRTSNLVSFSIMVMMFGVMFLSSARFLAANSHLIQPDHWLAPATPMPAPAGSRLVDQVVIHYPAKMNYLCWDINLPCEPEINTSLRVRADEHGNILMFYVEK